MDNSFDFGEFDSPGARQFADAARRHFGDRISESAIKGVIKNIKDDVALSALGMYIDEDKKFQLTVYRLLEVAVYLLYMVRFSAGREAEKEKETGSNEMETDDLWGKVD